MDPWYVDYGFCIDELYKRICITLAKEIIYKAGSEISLNLCFPICSL